MSKLLVEMETDRFGREHLHFRKEKGRITIHEIDAYLAKNVWRCEGYWVLDFCSKEDTYQGWPQYDERVPSADCADLIRIQSGDPCPLCAKAFPGDYCPHCGETIRPEDYK